MNTENAGALWSQALQILVTKEETKTPLAKVYLDYLIPISYTENSFLFATRLLQAKSWIEERYLYIIEEALSLITGSPLSVSITIDETASHSGVDQNPSTTPQASSFSQSQTTYPNQVPLEASPIPKQQHSPHSTEQFTQINSSPSSLPNTPPPYQNQSTGVSTVFAHDEVEQTPPSREESRFTFNDYVVGDSNKFAYSTALGVAESPGLKFNPLFIYGRSGLGKTHLLLAIKNYVSTYHPNKRVVYAPTSEFVNDFTNAMAGDRDLTSFKRKYHTCDVLLIDDVQNLEGKEGTTDALFEIFNLFIDHQKQIVLSADRSPREIKLDERFTSRFAQGITADIQPPNFEMKSAILQSYKRYYCNFLSIPEVDFTDEAIQQIVDLSGTNIRELEGAITNLIVFASYRPDNQKNIPLTCEDITNVIGTSFFHKNTRRIDTNMVMGAVESYFSVSREELLSDKRSKNISHPRQVAMYLLRRYTDMSYPDIGDSFNKDHTTAIYADKNIQSKMVEEVSVKAEIDRIAEILTS